MQGGIYSILAPRDGGNTVAGVWYPVLSISG